MADIDAEELAYYHELCERMRACRRALHGTDGYTFTRPPVSEARLRTTEAAVGFPLPPLLRLLYLEVADGGPGLIDEHEELVASEDLDSAVTRHPTGWRLHPCIERALQYYQLSYVRCAALPDRFIRIGPTGHCDLLLDAVSGRIYQSEYVGMLPPRHKGERIDLFSLTFSRGSLWEICERWLDRHGYSQHSQPDPAVFGTRHVVRTPHARWSELTPEILDPARQETPEFIWRGVNFGVQPGLPDPACQDDPARVWDGLYPGVNPITWSSYDTGVHPFDELEEKVASYVPPGGWPDE